MCTKCTKRTQRHERGLTLIELVVFIVIVSVALAGVLTVLNISVKGSADPMITKQMMSIAEALMDEVRMKPFTYCDPDDANASTANNFLSGGTVACANASLIENLGPETVSGTETRGSATPAFDNINDYSGISSATLQNDVSNLIPIPSGYTAAISITATDTLGPSGLVITGTSTPATMVLLRIRVTVTHGTESLMLESYRTRYAPNT